MEGSIRLLSSVSMAYRTYTTDAIVCGFAPLKEHDAVLRLFTKEAGMLSVHAGGIRAGHSKLRYGLQDFSYASVTLVRGKYAWRVTGAVAFDNFYFRARTRGARAALLSGMRALCRFIQGTDSNPALFDCVREGLQTLAEAHRDGYEELFTLRLLHQLGYVPPRPLYSALLHAPRLGSVDVLHDANPGLVGELRAAVLQAVSASHL